MKTFPKPVHMYTRYFCKTTADNSFRFKNGNKSLMMHSLSSDKIGNSKVTGVKHERSMDNPKITPEVSIKDSRHLRLPLYALLQLM